MMTYRAFLFRARQKLAYPLWLPIDVSCGNVQSIVITENEHDASSIASAYLAAAPNVAEISLMPQASYRWRLDPWKGRQPDLGELLEGVCDRIATLVPSSPMITRCGDVVTARYDLATPVSLVELTNRGLRGPPYYEDGWATLTYTPT